MEKKLPQVATEEPRRSSWNWSGEEGLWLERSAWTLQGTATSSELAPLSDSNENGKEGLALVSFAHS